MNYGHKSRGSCTCDWSIFDVTSSHSYSNMCSVLFPNVKLAHVINVSQVFIPYDLVAFIIVSTLVLPVKLCFSFTATTTNSRTTKRAASARRVRTVRVIALALIATTCSSADSVSSCTASRRRCCVTSTTATRSTVPTSAATVTSGRWKAGR